MLLQLWKVWERSSEEKRKRFVEMSDEYAKCKDNNYTRKHSKPYEFYLMMHRVYERRKDPCGNAGIE